MWPTVVDPIVSERTSGIETLKLAISEPSEIIVGLHVPLRRRLELPLAALDPTLDILHLRPPGDSVLYDSQTGRARQIF